MGLFTPNATVDWRVVGEKDKKSEVDKNTEWLPPPPPLKKTPFNLSSIRFV